MKLETEFYKLPLTFDVDLLKKEIAQFTEAEWQMHPQGFPGNSALLLVAANADPTNNDLKGAMKPTIHLERCPYLQQVLESFQTVIGRTRLMRLGGAAEVTPHTDANYYWQQRVRIHVPIVTYPEVQFICGDESVNMAEGETWIFDTAKIHNVINPTPHTRIHLVADSVGTADFWNLVAQSETPCLETNAIAKPPQFIPYNPHHKAKLITENFNAPIVMSPWEQKYLLSLFWESFWEADNDVSDEQIALLEKALNDFQWDWMGLWARYETEQTGLSFYQQAIDKLDANLQQFQDAGLRTSNGINMVTTLSQLLILPALNPDLAIAQTNKNAPIHLTASPETDNNTVTKSSLQAATPTSASTTIDQKIERFDRPIFIVAAPRSGSTFLFETLMRSPSVVTIGDESHGIFEGIPELNPANRDFDSNRLTEDDLTPEIAATLKQNFLAQLKDIHGNAISSQSQPFRMLEKTPKNALRIPFLNAAFPDARFIYLYREPNENISSIIEAWKSERFVTYRNLPDWPGKPWSLLLIPEWRKLKKKSLAQIASTQWQVSHQYMLDDLENIEPQRYCGVNYTDLVAHPQREIERLCAFAEIDWTQDIDAENLPLSRFTVTPPDPNKWRKHATILKPFLPKMTSTSKRAKQTLQNNSFNTFQSVPAVKTLAMQPMLTVNVVEKDEFVEPEEKKHTNPLVLKSRATKGFIKILHQLKTSLVVSAPQSNRLIFVSASAKDCLTEYREFAAPTAIAGDMARLSIATPYQIHYLRNMPAVAHKLEPIGKYDAGYLHRKSHVTGDLSIQDMAYIKHELWFVSSRFSCLCTMDLPHSFIPRWRPSFLKALKADDACHLNGLAIANDQPKYATAWSETSYAEGWKKSQVPNGIVIDIESNEIILRGLALPNSPRWYANKLWLLEAGTGTLATVNLESHQLEAIAKIPGFINGLSFAGNYAFVGVSAGQNVVTASPSQKDSQDNCGVYIINIKTKKIEGNVTFSEPLGISSLVALNNVRCPDVMNPEEMLVGKSYALSDDALKDVSVVG